MRENGKHEEEERSNTNQSIIGRIPPKVRENEWEGERKRGKRQMRVRKQNRLLSGNRKTVLIWFYQFIREIIGLDKRTEDESLILMNRAKLMKIVWNTKNQKSQKSQNNFLNTRIRQKRQKCHKWLCPLIFLSKSQTRIKREECAHIFRTFTYIFGGARRRRGRVWEKKWKKEEKEMTGGKVGKRRMHRVYGQQSAQNRIGNHRAQCTQLFWFSEKKIYREKNEWKRLIWAKIF